MILATIKQSGTGVRQQMFQFDKLIFKIICFVYMTNYFMFIDNPEEFF